MTDLEGLFGRIDVYLFDQLLRGHLPPGTRLVDAGCGSGRNLVYFLREGYPVRAADSDPQAVQRVRELARRLAPQLADEAFRVAPVEATGFEESSADAVVCNAVLHFARDHGHFDAMVDGLWRLLAPGGLLFARLASSIGIEGTIEPLGDGRHLLPDGSRRYLVDLERLLATTRRLGATLVDPIKTTNVQGMRCMTTWVLRRP